MIVGIISDTHGLLRDSAIAALAGSAHIVHAGDIGRPEILARLSEIAAVTAVRGNIDVGPWAEGLPADARRNFAGVTLYVTHDIAKLSIEPAAEQVQVVITGHSHKVREERRGGVLYLNPGSAGPRRFRLPVTLMRLRIAPDDLHVEIVRLS